VAFSINYVESPDFITMQLVLPKPKWCVLYSEINLLTGIGVDCSIKWSIMKTFA